MLAKQHDVAQLTKLIDAVLAGSANPLEYPKRDSLVRPVVVAPVAPPEAPPAPIEAAPEAPAEPDRFQLAAPPTEGAA